MFEDEEEDDYCPGGEAPRGACGTSVPDTQRSLFSRGDSQEMFKTLFGQEDDANFGAVPAASRPPASADKPQESPSLRSVGAVPPGQRRRIIPGPAGLVARKRGRKKQSGSATREQEEEGEDAEAGSSGSPSRSRTDPPGATKFFETPQWKQMLRDHQQDEDDADAIINR